MPPPPPCCRPAPLPRRPRRRWPPPRPSGRWSRPLASCSPAGRPGRRGHAAPLPPPHRRHRRRRRAPRSPAPPPPPPRPRRPRRRSPPPPPRPPGAAARPLGRARGSLAGLVSSRRRRSRAPGRGLASGGAHLWPPPRGVVAAPQPRRERLAPAGLSGRARPCAGLFGPGAPTGAPPPPVLGQARTLPGALGPVHLLSGDFTGGNKEKKPLLSAGPHSADDRPLLASSSERPSLVSPWRRKTFLSLKAWWCWPSRAERRRGLPLSSGPRLDFALS